MSRNTPCLEPSPISEDDPFYEVVGGLRVEKSPSGAFESWVVSILGQFLGPHASENGLGRVLIETLFEIDGEAGLARRPDLAFVSFDRWPKTRRVPRTAAWGVVPDLAVEMVSPSNSASEVVIKIRDYFRAGVRDVWVLHPLEGLIYLHESPTSVRILSLEAGEALDGGALIPGFSIPLATLFDVEAAD